MVIGSLVLGTMWHSCSILMAVSSQLTTSKKKYDSLMYLSFGGLSIDSRHFPHAQDSPLTIKE